LNCASFEIESGRTRGQFAVGYKFEGKTGHVVVDAEDALIAALKVKMERPEVLIAYVRQQINEATPVTLCADSAARAAKLNALRGRIP
jgi:hypothetical protein